MNSVVLHTEYLLRHHDCVVLPGWGAFIANRLPARFDAENPDVLHPPMRRVAFNPELTDSDGLLAASIGRRESLPYGEASRIVAAGVKAALEQLDSEGELMFGRLGAFMKLPGRAACFYPATATVNSRYYGLSPLRLRALALSRRDTAPASLPPVPVVARPAANDDQAAPCQTASSPRRWVRNIGAAVALLAVAITVGLFVANPIRVAQEPEKASIAPIAKAETENCQSLAADQTTASAAVEAAEETAGQSATVVDDMPQAEAIAQGQPAAVVAPAHEPAQTSERFSNTDPYVVVVASFPTAAQARQYLLDNSSLTLDVIESDGKFRVYSATGRTYAEARAQRQSAPVADAWVCRR